MLGTLLLIIHIIVAVFMCVVILMQSSKGEGLSGAFGLGQGTTSFFGADTANVLVKITVVLAVVFMLTSLSLAYIQSRKARPVGLEPETAGEASMTAPPGEEGEEAEEATVPEGETTPEAGEAEQPDTSSGTELGAGEAEAEELPVDEPPGEPVEPDSGGPLEPTGTDS